ncbi:unnamed protein product, partial [marine sediment metagenome]
DGGGGTTVDATSTAHGYVTGDIVTITGSTNFNDTYVVTVDIDADTFTFTDTWASTAGETGTANALTPTMVTNPVMGIFNHTTTTADDLVVFDKERMNTFVDDAVTGMEISSIADNAPDITITTTATVTIQVEDVITLSGSTGYDGTYDVTAVAGATFDVHATFVATGTGQANQEKFLDATRDQLRFIHNGSQDTLPVADDIVTGGTSGATGVVESTVVDFGDMTADTGHGTIVFQKGSIAGTFQTGEQLATGAEIYGNAVGTVFNGAFTGDSTQFFWVVNWNGVMYITNGKDAMQKYNGSVLAPWVIDVGTDAARTGENNASAVAMIFVVKNRLVLFSLTETGDGVGGQRARWSSIGDGESWPASNFKDAPTDEKIVAGAWIGDDLYIGFERSIWRFVWTGDAANPFEWQRISSTDGCVARHGMVAIPATNTQMILGPDQLLGNDGRQVIGVD